MWAIACDQLAGGRTPGMPGQIGPHEGRELELMLSGCKPLSMFVADADGLFPEQDFDAQVAMGVLKKSVSEETVVAPHGGTAKVRRVMYSLQGEEWRIEAMRLVLGVYDTSGPGWKPDLERIIGTLLGYEREDIEEFIDRVLARSSTATPK
jgi:hypothetical protein